MSKNRNIKDDSPIKSGTNGSDAKKYSEKFDNIDWSVKSDGDKKIEDKSNER